MATDTETSDSRAARQYVQGEMEDGASWRVSNGDASEPLLVGDVELTITSPPYLDAIDYDSHAEHGTGEDFRDTDVGELDIYLEEMRSVFSNVLNVTVDGGYCAVVIGQVTDSDGDPVALPHHFAGMMRDVGWQFHERIIWNKVTGGTRQFGTTVQYPYPTYYYPNQMHEEIQVWTKGDSRTERNGGAIEIDDLMKKEVANNVWHITPEPPNVHTEDHPCPFPQEIPYRLTKLYTHPNEHVLDPMAGIMTTPLVASSMGRVATGIEMREEYVETGTERLREKTMERKDQLVPSYEKVSVAE